MLREREENKGAWRDKRQMRERQRNIEMGGTGTEGRKGGGVEKRRRESDGNNLRR